VDFPADPAHPRPLWVAVASATAIAGSLAADALLVAIGTAVFPATKGYTHFRFSDYGKLTVIGVIIACVAWPMVTWVSSRPRPLFFRLAIVVTVVLWIPDVWILKQGQPVRAVLVLMVMHVAIALVTYNALVHLAPARPSAAPSVAGPSAAGPPAS
jgi:bacteriorhodopsin